MHTLTAAITLVSLLGSPQDRPDAPVPAEAVVELASVRLPTSTHVDGKPDGEAAVLSILHDGRVVAASGELFDPTAPDEEQALVPLRTWLANAARVMPKKPIAAGQSLMIPDGELLLRVDAVAAFEHVQRMMELCGSAGIQIWKIELAVMPAGAGAEDDSADERAFVATSKAGMSLHAHLPHDIGIHEGEDGYEEPLEVTIRVLKQGDKVAKSDDPNAEFVYDDARSLEYGIGPRKPKTVPDLRDRLRDLRMARGYESLTLDVWTGVTHGEVVAAINAARDAGYKEITFIGRRR